MAEVQHPSFENHQLAGSAGKIALRIWPCQAARFVVLLSHGYGEHVGRYHHVADHFLSRSAAVYAPDHRGHGESDGQRVLIERFDDLVDDLHLSARRARLDHLGLPLVLIGHSMGGLVATRYAQVHGSELAALVLSAPALGLDPGLLSLLEMEPIPHTPIDSALLSRDAKVGRDYDADPLVWHGAFLRPTVESLLATIEEVAAGPGLGTLPTLWIHGEADQITPLERTRPTLERIRGRRFESLSYAGGRHELFNETNREEVLSAVTAFVDRSLD